MAAKTKTTTKKRGPGRPKGSKNKPKVEEVPAKRGPGRPKGSKNKKTATPTAPAKKTAAKKTASKKKTVSEVKKPKTKKQQAPQREFNDETGFVVGTDSDKIALELLKGGESRDAIVARVSKKLPNETRNGTEKPVTNMVSGVLNKLLARGYKVEQSFVVVPPKKRGRAAKKK